MGVKTRKGKTDFRAFARKWLKPGEMPMEPMSGIGIGRKRYCTVCNTMACRVIYKDKGCFCVDCGNKIKEYLPKQYHLLYKFKGKIPIWLWNLCDKYCLYKERTYKKL